MNTAYTCQFDFERIERRAAVQMSKENPLIFLGEKAVWAGDAAQSMQKSSDKKEVILTRGGAI